MKKGVKWTNNLTNNYIIKNKSRDTEYNVNLDRKTNANSIIILSNMFPNVGLLIS